MGSNLCTSDHLEPGSENNLCRAEKKAFPLGPFLCLCRAILCFFTALALGLLLSFSGPNFLRVVALGQFLVSIGPFFVSLGLLLWQDSRLMNKLQKESITYFGSKGALFLGSFGKISQRVRTLQVQRSVCYAGVREASDRE